MKNDGTLICWAAYASVPSVAPAPPVTDGFRQVSVGGNHMCGLKTDGSILCWGSNFFGQLAPPPPAPTGPEPADLSPNVPELTEFPFDPPTDPSDESAPGD